MPNFEAQIRFDYRSVQGLVLDLRHGGMVDDGSGYVERWINQAPAARGLYTGTHDGLSGVAALKDSTRAWRTNELRGEYVWNVTDGSMGRITANTEITVTATLAGGAINAWQPGDAYEITTFRLGDATQPVEANRPALVLSAGFQQAEFTRGSSHFLQLAADRKSHSALWTLAVEYDDPGDAANNQTIFGADNLELRKTDGSGDYGYRYGLIAVAGSGAMPTGEWMLAPATVGPTTANLYKDGVIDLSGNAVDVEIFQGNPSVYLGSSNGAANFCTMHLRGVQLWNRRLSPLEVDFAHHTLHTVNSYAQEPRCNMIWRAWTDVTNAQYGSQASRLNSARHAPQYFLIGESNGDTDRIQIACAIDGEVLPDTELGGDLFDLVTLEYPGTFTPIVRRDVGWSAIFDIEINAVGHYTFQVIRPNGGSQILHLDASANPEALIYVLFETLSISAGTKQNIRDDVASYINSLGYGVDVIIATIDTIAKAATGVNPGDILNTLIGKNLSAGFVSAGDPELGSSDITIEAFQQAESFATAVYIDFDVIPV